MVTSEPHRSSRKSLLSQTRHHLQKRKGERVTNMNSKRNSTVRWQNIIKIAACEIQDYFLKANV